MSHWQLRIVLLYWVIQATETISCVPHCGLLHSTMHLLSTSCQKYCYSKKNSQLKVVCGALRVHIFQCYYFYMLKIKSSGCSLYNQWSGNYEDYSIDSEVIFCYLSGKHIMSDKVYTETTFKYKCPCSNKNATEYLKTNTTDAECASFFWKQSFLIALWNSCCSRHNVE
jgi:hypothetical protein